MLHRPIVRSSERGAAQVSVIWPVVFGVGFLGAGVFAWAQSSKVESVNKALDEANTRYREIEARADGELTKFKAFAAVTGWAKDGFGSVDAVKAALEEAKKSLGADAPAGGTIQDHLAASLKVGTLRAEQIAARDRDIQAKDTEISGKTREVASVRDTLQKQLDDAKKSAADKESTDAARIQNLEGQLAQKETAAKDATAQVATIKEEKEKEAAEWVKKYSLVDAKNADLNTKLAFLRAPAEPKGSVVEVSETLPIAYVDLGQHERVVAGMRFQVMEYDKNRKLAGKGYCEVTSVEGNMSRVRLEPADKNRPIAKGDLLLNPLYDPKGERRAVLVGRFPLTSGGRKGVEQKLGDLGIKVAEKIDPSVDYLIVGSPEYSNTGEMMDLEANDQVLAAAKYGTLRYALKDLEGYFKR